MARERNYCFQEVLAFTALVSVECTNVGMNTLYKVALTKGLNFHVYMAYSYAISAIILLPLAFFFHRSIIFPKFSPIKPPVPLKSFVVCRNTQLPPFTIILVAKFSILGFLGYAHWLLLFKTFFVTGYAAGFQANMWATWGSSTLVQLWLQPWATSLQLLPSSSPLSSGPPLFFLNQNPIK